MRFSLATLLALPLLAAATQQESPLEQAKAQAQYYFDKISSYIPNPSKPHTVDINAATAKVGGNALNILTLESWEETIRSSVKPASSKPEEWWVLITGGNKTCFGRCETVEKAYNETAILFAANPTAPHLGYLDCEAQPVLCSAWGTGPPTLWIMNVAAKPAPVDVRILTLNSTTTNVKTFTDLHATQSWKETTPYEGWFHPFDGQLAQYGLAVPIGYFFWIFAVVPSWMFMIGISFVSRNIMSKRTLGPQAGRPAGGAPAPAARVRVGAPPGDGIGY
ncbi:hypothetical protein D0Z07_8288 [Hyphodiscus hymeniophilus]|uniref:Peptidyl-tRNA hydrolase n=1 Tax=Hyphodiscus hymeniophilus TaxID=353542 RepID=A0A9P6SNJ6_9HELO|nr:hypothetical protein D0Z07_8288 [Hyphodiscus hymeniophilus]